MRTPSRRLAVDYRAGHHFAYKQRPLVAQFAHYPLMRKGAVDAVLAAAQVGQHPIVGEVDTHLLVQRWR